MDSAEARTRIKDGDYVLLHPVPLDESIIGKVVILNLPSMMYAKQAVRITSTYLTARCFNPYRTDMRFPVKDISAVYSVDEVLGGSVDIVPISSESPGNMPDGMGW